MNNRMLTHVEADYARGKSNKLLGGHAMWLTPEQTAKWNKGRPFKSRMHDKVHLKVYHGDMIGQSRSWLTAAKRLEAKEVYIPQLQKQEWY
jgi:hypothetical protein